MGDPSLENQTASIVDRILKDLIEGAGQDLIEGALIAEFPFLGLPFVKQLMEFVLSKASALIYSNAAISLTKIIIDMQVNQEKSDVLNAFQTLQMAIASGDKNAIDQASKDLSKAYGSIIHSDGSASP